MDCKHSYRKDRDNKLYCSLNDEICPIVKFCHKPEEKRWVSTDNYKNLCKNSRKEEVEILKQGNNKIRFEKKGLLYIEADDMVITTPNPFGENIPKYTNVVKIKGDYYVKGYEPKKDIKEFTNSKSNADN